MFLPYLLVTRPLSVGGANLGIGLSGICSEITVRLFDDNLTVNLLLVIGHYCKYLRIKFIEK